MQIKRIVPGDSLDDAFKVRNIVFVEEQGFAAEIEVDNKDPVAHHIVVYDRDGSPIATARAFPEEPGSDSYVIGRVAVLRELRGTGLGLLVMSEIEKLATMLGARFVKLGAQIQALDFYKKCGYSELGERYFEEHCEHAHMIKNLHS